MRWHAQTLPWWSQALNMQELNVTEIKDEFSCHWCWGLRCRAGGRSCIETGSNSPVIWEIQFLKKRNTVTESEKYKWWWGADMQSRRQAMYRGSDPPVTSSSAPFLPTGQRNLLRCTRFLPTGWPGNKTIEANSSSAALGAAVYYILLHFALEIF